MRLSGVKAVREIINGSWENCIDIIQQQSTTCVTVTVAINLDMAVEVRLVQVLNQNLDGTLDIIE